VTNDLGMPKESLSLIRLLFTPLNIVLAFFSSYLTAKAPFKAIRLAYAADMLVNAYGILVLAGTFPARDKISNLTVIHVSIYMLVVNLIQTFEMVSTFAFVM